MRYVLKLMLPVFVATVVGCGGGGGGGKAAVDEDGILENVRITNLNATGVYGARNSSWGFDTHPVCDDRERLEREGFLNTEGCPYHRPPSMEGWEDSTADRLKKWDIASDGLIPVKHNDVELAIYAMEVIEEKLGIILFDRNSIVNVPDEDIERGLIVSEGTATGQIGGAQSNACGNVEPIAKPINADEEWYDERGVIFGPLVVHLGSDDPAGCTVKIDMKEVAVHEFMHALGMGAHFEGFGIGPIYSDDAWNVLHNIVMNHPNDRDIDLIIEKRFPEK